MGEQANFAALAQQLKSAGSDFDALIGEIAATPESNAEAAKLELVGAIRQTKMKLLTTELERVAAAGFATEEAKTRYRELSTQREALRRQAAAEIAQR